MSKDFYYNGTHYSSSCGITKIINNEGAKNMSFAMFLQKNEEIYIISDSRSTTIYENGTKTYTDNCQKIVRVPNTDVFIVSTGINIFGNKNLVDIVSELTCTNFFDICEEFKDKMYFFRDSISYYIIGIYDKNHMFCFNGEHYTKLSTKNEYAFWGTIGESWATTVAKNFNFINKETALKFFEFLYQSDCFFNNTIGGPIQMVRITPEKAEWVEGYKPDFIKD